MMCPTMTGRGSDMMICGAVQIFLLIWVIFVPIVITARLEQIIKLLKEKK